MKKLFVSMKETLIQIKLQRNTYFHATRIKFINSVINHGVNSAPGVAETEVIPLHLLRD